MAAIGPLAEIALPEGAVGVQVADDQGAVQRPGGVGDLWLRAGLDPVHIALEHARHHGKKEDRNEHEQADHGQEQAFHRWRVSRFWFNEA